MYCVPCSNYLYFQYFIMCVQEMCSVAAYMCSPNRREVIPYLEEAVSVYNLSCKYVYPSIDFYF